MHGPSNRDLNLAAEKFFSSSISDQYDKVSWKQRKVPPLPFKFTLKASSP